jgi:hypothetical protein
LACADARNLVGMDSRLVRLVRIESCDRRAEVLSLALGPTSITLKPLNAQKAAENNCETQKTRSTVFFQRPSASSARSASAFGHKNATQRGDFDANRL